MPCDRWRGVASGEGPLGLGCRGFPDGVVCVRFAGAVETG